MLISFAEIDTPRTAALPPKTKRLLLRMKQSFKLLKIRRRERQKTAKSGQEVVAYVQRFARLQILSVTCARSLYCSSSHVRLTKPPIDDCSTNEGTYEEPPPAVLPNLFTPNPSLKLAINCFFIIRRRINASFLVNIKLDGTIGVRVRTLEQPDTTLNPLER